MQGLLFFVSKKVVVNDENDEREARFSRVENDRSIAITSQHM
jgi:hypothetical protein